MAETALFGGGCFWCVEAVFLSLKGVIQVKSGYAGGHVENPSYEQVCQGDTAHAEVILIEYDASQIEYRQLLDVFFATHDPTTINRQGNDIGTHYRSVIYYATPEQQQIAHDYIDELKQDGIAVVTELSNWPKFYPAEDYHQNYFAKNPEQGYCNFAIPPKLAKLRQKFNALLREQSK